MNKTGILQINITPEHMTLYNLIRSNSKHLDTVNDNYKAILDIILSSACRLKGGDYDSFDRDGLVDEVLLEAFGNLTPVGLRVEVSNLVDSILNYYSFMLIDLHVAETTLFLDRVDSNGIVITKYETNHLDSIQHERNDR